MKKKTIKYEVWVQEYKPYLTPEGKLKDFHSSNSADCNKLFKASLEKKVWTLLIEKTGKPPIIVSGYHLNNRLAFYITRNAVGEKESIFII